MIDCPYRLIGYGGARGGGKTDGVLGKYGIKAETYGKKFNAIFFRKELPQADDLIERAKEIYLPIGAHWQDQKKQFTFPSGGRLRFRPLETEADAEKYQGQNLTDVAIEEAGNYPDYKPIFKLFGALRSSTGVPTQMILTFNPGGPGHYWIKDKFIRQAPRGFKRLEWKLSNGNVVPYVFIRSLIQDNQILLNKDPEYIDNLHMVGSPELVRAWLEGDFEIHEGSYFSTFGQRHIINPPRLDNMKHWPKYVGFDWGYQSPFCAVWGAVSSGKWDDGSECLYPKNSIIIYRECWGKRIENVDIAKKIIDLTGDEDPIMVADPSIFSHDGGPSINDQFNVVFGAHKFTSFRKADNDRVSGWSQILRRLAPKEPMIYFSTNCPYLIETIPGLAMDKKNAEDVDTTGEDHGGDALRYLCKERLLESILAIKSEPVIRGTVKVQEYINQVRRDQNRVRV